MVINYKFITAMAEYNYAEMEKTARKVHNYFKIKGAESSIKVSRYRKEIKTLEVYSVLPINDLLNALGISANIGDLDISEEKSISGKYKTKLVTAKNHISGVLDVNETFFILNRFTEKGTLKNKEVAPEKLGITVSRYKSLGDFDRDVYAGIEKMKIEPSVKAALKGLYTDVVSSNKAPIQYSPSTKDVMDVIKPQDKQAIGKDFGEVLSLRWYVSNFPGWNDFGFSTVSNAPLVDYTVKYGKTTANISAKFQAGAAPSILAIVSGLDKAYPNPNIEEKKAINVLKALGSPTGTTSFKILNAYKELSLPGYKELQNICGKDNVSLEDISKVIHKIASSLDNKAKRSEAFLKLFDSFYKAINKTVDKTSLDTVFESKTYSKYFSLVLSPMGYALVSYMNSTPIFQEVLNVVSRNLDVEQVYLTFAPTSMDIKKKLFSKAQFKFSYGANAKNSDNTGIKFSMSK